MSVPQIETSQQDVNLGRDLRKALLKHNAKRDQTHSAKTKFEGNRKESLLAVRLDDCSSLSSYSSLEGAAIQTAEMLNYTNEVLAHGTLPISFS